MHIITPHAGVYDLDICSFSEFFVVPPAAFLFGCSSWSDTESMLQACTSVTM